MGHRRAGMALRQSAERRRSILPRPLTYEAAKEPPTGGASPPQPPRVGARHERVFVRGTPGERRASREYRRNGASRRVERSGGPRRGSRERREESHAAVDTASPGRRIGVFDPKTRISSRPGILSAPRRTSRVPTVFSHRGAPEPRSTPDERKTYGVASGTGPNRCFSRRPARLDRDLRDGWEANASPGCTPPLHRKNAAGGGEMAYPPASLRGLAPFFAVRANPLDPARSAPTRPRAPGKKR